MSRIRTHLLVVTAVLVIVMGSSGSAVAGEPTTLAFETPLEGKVQITDEGLLEERLALPDAMAHDLMKNRGSSMIRLVDWPIAPGDHRTVEVKPLDVYATGAKICEVNTEGVRLVPRSPRKYFVGRIEGESESGVLVIVDPRTGRVSGLAISGGESFDMVPVPGGRGGEVSVVATREKVGKYNPVWDCGEERLGELFKMPARRATLKTEATTKASNPLEAVIAVDTDTELLSLKFSNNTGDASDYVADLFAAINVMYSRDLDLTLVQGTTYLRTGSDPYSVNSGSSASTSELYEFANYWKSSYSGVSRALAALLSGKSPSNNSASGIAWVGALCSKTNGYSFSKVFKINYLSGDAKIVGHEIGHNFGSKHTHCYVPAIDHCYNQEGGCYTGTSSCPGGAGTIMSYCHITGCGSTLDFHPTVISNILNNHVGPATNVCIFEASSNDFLFECDFETGGTGDWTETVP